MGSDTGTGTAEDAGSDISADMSGNAEDTIEVEDVETLG